MPDIFTQSPEKPATNIPQKQDVVASHPQSVPPQIQQNEPSYTHVSESTNKFPKGGSLGLLSSFRMHPSGIKFQNQEKDEHIILFIRRHFIVNIPWIFFTILFLLVPIGVITLINISGLQLFEIPQMMVWIMIAFYYLVVLTYALINFIIWFYHVGIVTQKRLLDLDVYNILSHHLAETEIADIVDVSHAQKGFFQSFFNYGDVPIQTEAIKANFEFEASPKPAIVSDIITDLRPKRHHEQVNLHELGK